MNQIAQPQTFIGQRKPIFRLAAFVPFFLGAALYLSLIFAIFAALPLIYSHLRLGRVGGMLCSITNTAIIWALSGRENAAVYFVLAVVPAIAISECLKLKLRIEWNVVYTVVTTVLVSALLLVSYSHKYKINPLQKLDSFVEDVVHQVGANVEKYKATSSISSQDLEKFLVDPEMTKRNILYELPCAITITLLVLAVSNLLLVLRLNFNGVRSALGLQPGYFKTWRAPEHMVWPTLIAGFCIIVEIPVLSDIGLNVFKIFMAIYALQGLAITQYIFDLWGIKGFLRPLCYVLAVAILLPLVISIGFFDLWFNFREKFKTTQ